MYNKNNIGIVLFLKTKKQGYWLPYLGTGESFGTWDVFPKEFDCGLMVLGAISFWK